MTPAEEGLRFLNLLDHHLQFSLDGRQTILELKRVDYHWRQMEWIGWGFEYLGSRILKEHGGATDGPTFGRTKFDVRGHFVWDLKAHPSQAGPCILNDAEAVRDCIEHFDGIGFMIASGEVVYDDLSESFKQWHDTLKGGLSVYERDRVQRGAPSRRRKVSIALRRLDAFWIPNRDSLAAAVRSGLLGFFQEGMRNADGSPRRAKYMARSLDMLRASSLSIGSLQRRADHY